MTTLGARIAHLLADRGITTVFGVPGVHNIELYRGLEAAGLRHVLARHEQGAGFMADGYARATGRPGVAFVITGPGLTNIMTPMGQAYSDSVPLLVISSCLDPADPGLGRGRLHAMRDQQGAAATVCDWSHTAHDAATAYALVDRALAEFAADRPRPKHIQIPIPVLEAQAPPFPPAVAAPARPVASADAIAEVAARLDRADRPLFIFGGGARGAGSVTRLVDRLGAAAFTTYAGRGLVAPDYPLGYGAMLARPDSAATLASADLVVAVGTELSEVDLWRDALGHTAPLIRVDIDSASLLDAHRAALAIRSDAAAFLQALDAATVNASRATGWQPTRIAADRGYWIAQIDADRPGIVPVCAALSQALPQDTHIYSDMTQFAYAAKEVWDMPAAGHWHHPYGFGTLGYALPAAIGGKIAAGDGPVLAIAGDYGLQYTLPELATAAELGLSLPILIWDNGALKEIEASMARAQIAPVAVHATAPDWQALATAYRLGHARPETLAALTGAIFDGFTARAPTLIVVTPSIAP